MGETDVGLAPAERGACHLASVTCHRGGCTWARACGMGGPDQESQQQGTQKDCEQQRFRIDRHTTLYTPTAYESVGGVGLRREKRVDAVRENRQM